MNRREYGERVLSCLRRLTPEERAAALAEIDGHIEDHMADLLDAGYDEALAEERTLGAMGDPEEVGRALERQYPLRWLVLGRIAVVLAVAAGIQMLLGLGMLGMVFDSVTARIYPNEPTELNTVASAERVDIRVPVGDDVLRVYRVSVGQCGDELGLWEAEVSLCAYDRLPGGIVSSRLLGETRLENQRGETGRHSGGRGSWRAEYQRMYAPLEPGDTFVTLAYERLGERVHLELPLPGEVGS